MTLINVKSEDGAHLRIHDCGIVSGFQIEIVPVGS